MSHLLQMRGLKRNAAGRRKPIRGSHLLQMRGLKLNRSQYCKSYSHVASFTDAWIETRLTKTVNAYLLSHLLQMRGLKPNNADKH